MWMGPVIRRSRPSSTGYDGRPRLDAMLKAIRRLCAKKTSWRWPNWPGSCPIDAVTDGVAKPGTESAFRGAGMQGRRAEGFERTQSARAHSCEWLASAAARRPHECALQPIVAPEQFAVCGHEARRPEDTALFCLLRLIPQSRLDWRGAHLRQDRIRLETELREDVADGGRVIDAAAFTKLCPKH